MVSREGRREEEGETGREEGTGTCDPQGMCYFFRKGNVIHTEMYFFRRTIVNCKINLSKHEIAPPRYLPKCVLLIS